MRTRCLGLSWPVVCLLFVACGSSSGGNTGTGGGSTGSGGGGVGSGGAAGAPAGGEGGAAGRDNGTGGIVGTGGVAASGGAGGANGAGGKGGSGSPVGSGGSVGFMEITPCAEAKDYQTGGTIAFPNGDNSYSPKCLKVKIGDTVTFNGDFSMHPLEAARRRGNTADNPITTTQSGTTRAFTFSVSGFYAYYCTTHGVPDDGTAMAGVIWAQ